MVDSKENYKFDLGVKRVKCSSDAVWISLSSLNCWISFSDCQTISFIVFVRIWNDIKTIPCRQVLPLLLSPGSRLQYQYFGEKLSFIPLGKNTLSKGLSFIRFWSCITQFLTLNYFLIPSWSDPYKKLHDKTTVNIVWKGEELARYPEWKMKSYHDSKKCKARSKSEKKHMGINKMQNSA